MARRTPESRYQMGFDFTRRHESLSSEQAAQSSSLSRFNAREPGLGRFIRSVDDDTVIQTPSMAAHYLMMEVFSPFDDFTQEELVTLNLSTKNRITHMALIYRGTINAVQVRTAEIFRPAIQVNAASIMLAHNHPSGDPTPSPEDVRFTEVCVEAGRILDVNMLDHIIIVRVFEGERFGFCLKLWIKT